MQWNCQEKFAALLINIYWSVMQSIKQPASRDQSIAIRCSFIFPVIETNYTHLYLIISVLPERQLSMGEVRTIRPAGK